MNRHPRIILFDEGTANLDADSERTIAGVLTNLAPTRIIVAHRSQLLEAADIVYEIRDGASIAGSRSKTELEPQPRERSLSGLEHQCQGGGPPGSSLMQIMIRDFRYAWRQLRGAPGFSVLAVFTLTLGIGAHAAMFTVIESVLLQPLPYANPDRLVHIGPAESRGLGSTSWLNYRDIRGQAQSLEIVAGHSEDVGVVQSKDVSLSVVTHRGNPWSDAEPAWPAGCAASARADLRRIRRPRRRATGGDDFGGPLARVFARDPHIVGGLVRVNGRDRTVVGVMPRRFRFPESMGQDVEKGLWLPIQPTGEMQNDRGYHFLMVLAGLKPAATLPRLKRS